jgi:hypothetical protein
MWAWLKMLLRVPTGISCFLGTMAVSTAFSERRTNLTWLPFWVVSTNPAASSRRLTSRKGRGLSRPNLDLNGPDFGRPRSLWRLEMELQRLFQIGERFLFGFSLTGDVNFEALRDVPVSFAPNRCGKWTFHDRILAQYILLIQLVMWLADWESWGPEARPMRRPAARRCVGFGSRRECSKGGSRPDESSITIELPNPKPFASLVRPAGHRTSQAATVSCWCTGWTNPARMDCIRSPRRMPMTFAAMISNDAYNGARLV